MSKSPSLRRIQADIRELALDPSDRYHAAPLENDMFEWHFTIRGADGTDFAGGIYHGRILLPPDYPFKPPHIIMLTPSGRFETNTKICLSFSAFHPELWQPAWGIRLILEALISFLPTPADGAIGALDWTPAERKRLAAKSVDFVCPLCGKIANLIPPVNPDRLKDDANGKPSRFQKEIEELQRLQQLEHAKNENDDNDATQTNKSEEVHAEEASQLLDREGRNGNETNSTEEGKPGQPEASGPLAGPPPSVVDSLETQPEPLQVPPVLNIPAQQQETTSARPDSSQEARGTDDNPVTFQQQQLNVAADVPQQVHESKPSLLTDTVLQGIILVLSVICYILLRKVGDLLEELKALE